MPNPPAAGTEMPVHAVAAGLPVMSRPLGEILRDRR